MNLQYIRQNKPIRFVMTNPCTPASRMMILKLFSGVVFGPLQIIDLTLLVYENEKEQAELFILELESCAFSLANKLTVVTDIPRISDADVFCFITNLQNPNKLDFNKELTDEEFDSLYLLIKIANDFSKYPPSKNNLEEDLFGQEKEPIVKRKPIFITDGLVAMDILKTMSKCIENDSLFCPTCLSNIAKDILADFLKVRCGDINKTYAWAANEDIVHVEVQGPIIKHDKVDHLGSSHCVWNAMSAQMLRKLKVDTSLFNPSWMKKEYITRVKDALKTNPYGPIYKATQMARTLNVIWSTRTCDEKRRRAKKYMSLGVISNGCLGTIKDLPYVLPVTFRDDCWSINETFTTDIKASCEDSMTATSIMLKYVIRDMNAEAMEHHKKLVPFCKKFLYHNVINKEYIPLSPPESWNMFPPGWTLNMERWQIIMQKSDFDEIHESSIEDSYVFDKMRCNNSTSTVATLEEFH